MNVSGLPIIEYFTTKLFSSNLGPKAYGSRSSYLSNTATNGFLKIFKTGGGLQLNDYL